MVLIVVLIPILIPIGLVLVGPILSVAFVMNSDYYYYSGCCCKFLLCVFIGFLGLLLDVFFWIDTFDKSISIGIIKTKAINQVLQRLSDEGIYLPGDILEIKNYRENELKTLGKTDKEESSDQSKAA